MPPWMESICSDWLHVQPFLKRLQQVYEEMDAAYAAAADAYGFHCNGCRDNCCLTRFYHHTAAEVLYLLEGYRQMPAERRRAIAVRAAAVCRESASTEARGETPRVMCPLNEGDRCVLYERRPMICRLHGIPHELHRPGRQVLRGPGCEAFSDQCGEAVYHCFDRTPFYVKMAGLEQELRQSFGGSERIRMTVAEMIVAFGG